MKRLWSRRAVLRSGAVVGAITAAPPAVLGQLLATVPYVNLSDTEAITLEAMVSRLIPSDTNGPGAREAGAARYIDRELGQALAAYRRVYASGLLALDRYARSTAGNPFFLLTPERQDTVLADLEQNRAPGFTPSSAAFFDLVLGHTLEGTFGDPHYGGNQAFVGWEMLSYPGLALAVAPEQQRMGAVATPDYRSAYDHAQFDAHETDGERDDD
jgi:gluconate 2-dehydrogenase gamma chain